MKKAYLTLQNGKQFQGFRFGAEGEMVGELVFTTGMTGYIETLTDPSYYGQIVAQTFPLIGNYGMISSDCESKKSWVSAYIVRESAMTLQILGAKGLWNSTLKPIILSVFMVLIRANLQK